MGVHWKIQFLRGRGHEKPIYREQLRERGACTGGGAYRKRAGGVFEWGGGDTPMHTVELIDKLHC